MERPVLDSKFIFVVGSPRSGTTWLQHMLSSMPNVASINAELTVFSRYIAPWANNFRIEQSNIESGRWRQGLPLVMNREGLDRIIYDLLERIYGFVLRSSDNATFILDKHPNYANYIPLISTYLPNSYFIHIIRDGRDVAVSMVSVSRRVGHGPGDVRSAAKEWLRNYSNAHQAGTELGPTRYMEVRYEELLADPVPQLQRILKGVGLQSDISMVSRVVDEHHISKKLLSRGDGAAKQIDAVPAWHALGLHDRFRFDRIAGKALVSLGYAKPGWWAYGPLDKLWMTAYPPLVRVKRSVLAVIKAWTDPLESGEA